MSSRDSQFTFVSEYDIDEYGCGLMSGERLRLIRELRVEDHAGQTLAVHAPGEVWVVLRGSSLAPSVVWLRQPNGKPHTWDDSEEIFSWFERISPDS